MKPLARILTALLSLIGLTLVPFTAVAQDEPIFDDPEGSFSLPVPTNWTAAAQDGYVVLTDPDALIKVYALVVPGNDVSAAITAAWAIVQPDFTFAPIQDQEVPSSQGVELSRVLTQVNDDQTQVYQAVGQLVDGQVYILLFDADVVAATQRGAQINIIATGFTINAITQTDLTGMTALPIDAALLAELEAYINEILVTLEVPGASVAIVRDGEVVYTQGFGVRELGGTDPVTPDTLMMIGSTTKSFTTLLMAILVDEGVITWDTPVVDILPSFALQDPEVTQQITVRNLVCACSGVPRRDLEWVFNTNTAEGIIESLAEYALFTDFGEAFQYSNQMVASGGYIAALAAGGAYGDLEQAYLEVMQVRVFDPLGMTDATFSFDTVAASADYALPHGATLLGEYVPSPLALESVLTQVAPAGSLWSSANDMARYLITQLNRGVTPEGERIVSAENLELTWEPQVSVSSETSYGLGWLVEDYDGLQLIHHGGNTFGFTSD
ncbi:MAG: beta-lactamase family protein, partial [Armatimonadetes bacterium]|nr:beta-lactamase family protein [Anaerolineae bacterium]